MTAPITDGRYLAHVFATVREGIAQTVEIIRQLVREGQLVRTEQRVPAST